MIRADGFSIRNDSEVRDVGIGTALGQKRNIKVLKNREKGVNARVKRTRRLARTNRKAKKLLTTGTIPALDWGKTSLGVAPSVADRKRRLLVYGLGAPGARNCSVVTYAVNLGEARDPWVAACVAARKALPKVKGRIKKGTPLYDYAILRMAEVWPQPWLST